MAAKIANVRKVGEYQVVEVGRRVDDPIGMVGEMFTGGAPLMDTYVAVDYSSLKRSKLPLDKMREMMMALPVGKDRHYVFGVPDNMVDEVTHLSSDVQRSRGIGAGIGAGSTFVVATGTQLNAIVKQRARTGADTASAVYSR